MEAMMKRTKKAIGSWRKVQLGKVVRAASGIGFPKDLQGRSEGVYPVFKVGDISAAWLRGDKLLAESEHNLTEDLVKQLKGTPLPTGTTVFAKIGEGLKLNRRMLLARPALVDNNVMGLIPSDEVHPEYLYLFMTTVDLGELSQATTVPSVRKSDIDEIEIPLPPLPEQRRIVAAIETQLGRLDAAVASLHAAKVKLKRYKQAVLKAAVEGKLTDPDLVEGEIPEGWRIVPVEEVGQIVTGSTPSKRVPAYYGDDHPFYKPPDLEAGYETRESTDGLTDEGLGQARALPAKSILVTCIGATIGKTGLIRIAGACNQQINAIVPNAELVPEYGYFHCISPYFQKQIKDNASATTLPLLNKSRFKVLDFILPSMADQLKIVSEVEHRFDRVGELESSLDTQLWQASRLRQSVLKRAFEGKLVGGVAPGAP
ncbi:MAG TPA: restriction endonuclease subunit S [Flavobacteriales bacterium]|nr:restriction endonuclease subunit S [Flavobacteriales bacterium]